MCLACLIPTQSFLKGGCPSSVVNTPLGGTDLQRSPGEGSHSGRLSRGILEVIFAFCVCCVRLSLLC